MKTHSTWGTAKNPVKFRIPTADNLVPIRIDIEIDGQRFRDAFIWNPADPDSEVVVFAKRTVKDLKLPPAFVTQIAQSIQVVKGGSRVTDSYGETNASQGQDQKVGDVWEARALMHLSASRTQLTDFRSYEGQDMFIGEKVVPIKRDLRVNHTLIKDQFLWDLNNFESDPEEFAKTFCKDISIEDPEVGPAIAVAIREQLYEIAVQNVTSARESRIHKKGRRGFDHVQASKTGGNAVDLFKLFGNKSSVVRKRKEWDVYEPIVDLLSNEEVDALDAKEERNV
ncbi:hypothetical protein OROMI_033498 [Orobanche minor]